MNQNKYLTVSAISRYLKHKFDIDDNLKYVFLKGEISNFKAHTTGHFYFSVKDETSKINAIMFRTNASKLNFTPTDGMKVLIAGRISVYEATGGYQIYADEMMEDGVGNLYLAFEKLKSQLEKEGLFDSKYKKPIPKIPERIGVITASTGAAIKDITSTITRRFPLSEVYLFPALVQGENASSDIVKKIKQASLFDLDVLIVGRGGGSIEDLWPFNEEIVARAIFECDIPIISAVGHEVDFTIADFVADLRAPTPTGAAELAVPNIIDVKKNLNQLKIRYDQVVYQKVKMQRVLLDGYKNSFVIKNPKLMFDDKKQTLDLYLEKIKNLLFNKIENKKIELIHLKQSYVIKNPSFMFENKKQNLSLYYEKIKNLLSLKIENKKIELDHLKQSYIFTNSSILYKNEKIHLGHIIEQLEAFNPLNVLKRGYVIASKDDNIIRSVKNIKKNDLLDIRLSDGIINVIVNEIKEEENGKESC